MIGVRTTENLYIGAFFLLLISAIFLIGELYLWKRKKPFRFYTKVNKFYVDLKCYFYFSITLKEKKISCPVLKRSVGFFFFINDCNECRIFNLMFYFQFLFFVLTFDSLSLSLEYLAYFRRWKINSPMLYIICSTIVHYGDVKRIKSMIV